MNTKRLLLLFLCAISLSGIGKTTDPPNNVEVIHLRGSLDVNHGPNDVNAYVDQNNVYIYFNQNLGYVDVTIYNPNGLMVYNDVVNTAVQQQLVIPIAGLIDGVYTIVLENATGYADGEFEKNN